MSDQPVSLTTVEEKIFSLDVRVIEKARKSGDESVIAEHIKSLRRQGQINGLALAHTLWMWRNYHGEEYGDDGDWEDRVNADTGLSLQTIRKYTRMWEAIFVEGATLPEVQAALRGQPIQNLLLIAPAAKEDQLTEEQWTRLAEATDRNEVKGIIREVRGGQTSSNSALVIRLRRDGTLEAKRGENPFEAVGYLALDKKSIEVVDAAITRITRAAGIVEQ